MRTVLAALDASAAARPVLETAMSVAELTDAVVDAIHVQDGAIEPAAELTARNGIRFRLLTGPVAAALLDALAAPAVIAAVVGARGTPNGRRPAGRIAARILEQTDKPVVVVPPDAHTGPRRPLRRLLVPLEGTNTSSRPVAERLSALIAADVELIVLHVFTADTFPRFLDRPARDLEMLGGEFLDRYCPNATRVELHTGSVAGRIAELCREEDADFVVLSWSQVTSPGRAVVIREVPSHSTVPVLLLPVDGPRQPLNGPTETSSSQRRGVGPPEE